MTATALMRCFVLLAVLGCSGSTGPGPNPQNALYTVIVNRSSDSAFVLLKNYSTGPILRQQKFQPGDSTCWVTSIEADSAFYDVGVWVADSLWYPWGSPLGEGGFTLRGNSLQVTRKWLITINPGTPDPSANIGGLVSGPGC